MTSGGNKCNDFHEIVPTKQNREEFSLSRSWSSVYSLNGLMQHR